MARQYIGVKYFTADRHVVISAQNINNANYIVIQVPKSSSAPHQAPDKRFYKRSNNRSFPMESYEIDDVRNRRATVLSPIIVGLKVERSSLVRMVLRNRSEHLCRDLCFVVRSNFPMAAFEKKTDAQIRISRFGVNQVIEYPLHTAHGALAAAEDAAIEIEGTYYSEISAQPIQMLDRISIGELAHSALPHDEAAHQIQKVSEELRELRRELTKMTNAAQELNATIGGSGIRISPISLRQHRTLEATEASTFKYDVFGLTLQGMAEILETTIDVVRDLYSSSRYVGDDDLDKVIEALPAEVQLRAKERLSFR